MKNISALLLLSLLLFISNISLSAEYHAGADGNWQTLSTWVDGGGHPMLTLPGASDDVIIDGYNVTVTALGFVVSACNSLTIKADARNDHAYLRVDNGATLTVSNNVTVISPNNRNKNIYLYVYGTLDIGGDLDFERAANYTRNKHLELYINGGSVSVDGDFHYNYYRASTNETYDDVFMTNAASFTCTNVLFRKDLGGQINIDMSGSSQWRISGDFILDENGGKDFEFAMTGSSSIDIRGGFIAYCDGGEDLHLDLEQTAGTNHFHVGRDFYIDHNSGEDINIFMAREAQMIVDGNFTIDWDGARVNNSDINFEMYHNSLIDINGSVEIDMNETVRSSCDIIFDLDNDAKIEVGQNNGLMTEDCGITLSDGDKFDFELDRDANFIVYGEARFLQSGDGIMNIYLNQNSNGSTTDALLQVDGRFRINKTDGDAFRLYAKNDANIDIGGDFLISTTGFDGGWYHSEMQMEQNAVLDIDGNFSFVQNDPNSNNLILDMDQDAAIYVGVDDGNLAKSSTISMLNGNKLDIQFDRNAKFITFGNLTINQSGNEHFQLFLNENSNGTTTDAQLRVDGNMTITKDDGDNLDIRLNYGSGFDIGQNFIINDTGHDGDWQVDKLLLLNSSKIDVDGNFTFSVNPNKLVSTYIQLENLAQINVAGYTYLSQVNAGNLYLYLNQSTSSAAVISTAFNTGGDFDISYSASQDWVNSNFVVDQEANFTVGGNFSFENLGNYISASNFIYDRNAQININGYMKIVHDSKGEFVLNLNSNNNGSGSDVQMNVGGGFDFQASQTGSYKIECNDDADINIGGSLECDITGFANTWSSLNINLHNNSTINIIDNLSITKTGGANFNFNLYNNSAINVKGETRLGFSNATDWADFLLTLVDNSTFTSEGRFRMYNTSGAVTNLTKIQLENSAVLNIGTNNGVYNDNFDIRHNSLDHLQLRLYNNSTVNVYGSLIFDKQNNGNWSDGTVLIDDAARINIYKHFILKNSNNDRKVTVTLNDNNAVLNVRGNIDLTNAISQKRIIIKTLWASNLYIGGSFLRNAVPNRYGVLDCQNTSTVHYNGDGTYGQQKIAENAGSGTDAFNYQYVVINNTWGTVPQLSMEGETNIISGRSCTFTDGIVSANTDSLFIIANNATTPGANDNSYVDGYIKKVGRNPYVFPIGDDKGGSTYYAPVSISAPSNATDAFMAQYVLRGPNEVGDTTLIAPSLDHVSRVEYWHLDRVNGLSNVDVTLSWKDPRTGGVVDMTALRVAHWNSATPIWEDFGGSIVGGSTVADGSIMVSNVSNFSPFTISTTDAINPLPVEMLSFNAKVNNNIVDVNWETSSEINNDYFTIERSIDGVNFEEVATISGAGNSNEIKDYYYPDLSPFSGTSYYRIKQTDFDATFKYSEIKSVNFETETDNLGIIMYPNPVENTNSVNIDFSNNIEDVVFKILDMYGRAVNVEYSINANNVVLKTQELSKGIYFINLLIDGTKISRKLIVK